MEWAFSPIANVLRDHSVHLFVGKNAILSVKIFWEKFTNNGLNHHSSSEMPMHKGRNAVYV